MAARRPSLLASAAAVAAARPASPGSPGSPNAAAARPSLSAFVPRTAEKTVATLRLDAAGLGTGYSTNFVRRLVLPCDAAAVCAAVSRMVGDDYGSSSTTTDPRMFFLGQSNRMPYWFRVATLQLRTAAMERHGWATVTPFGAAASGYSQRNVGAWTEARFVRRAEPLEDEVDEDESTRFVAPAPPPIPPIADRLRQALQMCESVKERKDTLQYFSDLKISENAAAAAAFEASAKQRMNASLRSQRRRLEQHRAQGQTARLRAVTARAEAQAATEALGSAMEARLKEFAATKGARLTAMRKQMNKRPSKGRKFVPPPDDPTAMHLQLLVVNCQASFLAVPPPPPGVSVSEPTLPPAWSLPGIDEIATLVDQTIGPANGETGERWFCHAIAGDTGMSWVMPGSLLMRWFASEMASIDDLFPEVTKHLGHGKRLSPAIRLTGHRPANVPRGGAEALADLVAGRGAAPAPGKKKVSKAKAKREKEKRAKALADLGADSDNWVVLYRVDRSEMSWDEKLGLVLEKSRDPAREPVPKVYQFVYRSLGELRDAAEAAK